MEVRTRMFIYVYTYIVCICIYIYVYTYTDGWMDGWINMFTYACMHAHMCVRARMCAYMYIYTYIYISVHMHTYTRMLYVRPVSECNVSMHYVTNATSPGAFSDVFHAPLSADEPGLYYGVLRLCMSDWGKI